MKIEHKGSITAPPQNVWAFLIDPYQVASCLPGATITEKVDNQTYRGTITVKVGPVMATYKGSICFERVAPDIYEAEITGRGQEEKGKGGAEMRMESRLYALESGGTEVTVAAEVNLIGLLAQFGRGMIQDVSDHLFQQFTASMKSKLEAGSPADQPHPPAQAAYVNVLSLGSGAFGRALGRLIRRIFGSSKS
jgi:carbon monoxide dehydrogenase subunit G